MSDLAVACREIEAAAAEQGLGCALVGGFAVSVRTEPRFTRDVDLAVAVDDDRAAETFVRSVLGRGHTLVANVEHEAQGRLATSRVRLSGGEAVDLLFASSGIEREIVEAADPLEVLPGLTVPVARVGHLIALKLLARDDESRPQDAGDLRALVGVATAEDRELAAVAVRQIAARGFDRGRDLDAELDSLLDSR